MTSLRELQDAFAAALRDPGSSCAVTPAANLDVYRHQGERQFVTVLGISFPVVRRRVGDEYFRQLAHHYRRAHPSRSGDLQWLGRDFAAFLRSHLGGGEYVWLADLAWLEWLRELAAIAPSAPAIEAVVLAETAPEELEHLRFELQPSLALFESPYPVFSVWAANQGQHAPPVDQSLGQEQGMVLDRHDGVVVRRLDPPLFRFIAALRGGQTLGDALSVAGLDETGLSRALRFVFAERLVCAVVQRSNR